MTVYIQGFAPVSLSAPAREVTYRSTPSAPPLCYGYMRNCILDGDRHAHALISYDPDDLEAASRWRLVASCTSFESALAAGRLMSGVAHASRSDVRETQLRKLESEVGR